MLSRSPFGTPRVTRAVHSALRQVTAAARSPPAGEAAATEGAAAASPGNSPTGSRRARPGPRSPASPSTPGAGRPGPSDLLGFHLVDGHPHRLRAFAFKPVLQQHHRHRTPVFCRLNTAAALRPTGGDTPGSTIASVAGPTFLRPRWQGLRTGGREGAQYPPQAGMTPVEPGMTPVERSGPGVRSDERPPR